MGNEDLYSVGKEWEKLHSKKQQVVGFVGHSRLGLSRESIVSQVVKTTSSQILHQTLTHNPYIKSHKSTAKWLEKITIKFDTKLKPTKYIVVNNNFTISPFGYSMTNPLNRL